MHQLSNDIKYYVIIVLHLVLTEFTRHRWPRLPTHWPKYPGHVWNYPARHCFSFCDLIGWQTIPLTFNFHIWKEDSQRILRMYVTHPWDCGIPSEHMLNEVRSKALRNSTPLPYTFWSGVGLPRWTWNWIEFIFIAWKIPRSPRGWVWRNTHFADGGLFVYWPKTSLLRAAEISWIYGQRIALEIRLLNSTHWDRFALMSCYSNGMEISSAEFLKLYKCISYVLNIACLLPTARQM